MNRKSNWACGYDGDLGDRGCQAAMSCTTTGERPADVLRDVNVASPGSEATEQVGLVVFHALFPSSGG